VPYAPVRKILAIPQNEPAAISESWRGDERSGDELATMSWRLHCFEARNLAMAVRMMAGSGDLPKDAGTALEVVADLIFEKLIGACDERTRLWKLAGKIAE
jgi:hypothetical protein